MDNISRDNNSSYLPMAGVIVGVIALLVSIGAFLKASGAKSDITELSTSVTSKISDAESAAQKAQTTADKAASDSAGMWDQVTKGFTQYSTAISQLQKEVADSKTKPAVVKGENSSKGDKTQVAAAKGEYLVKSGDNGTRIAKETGFTVAELTAANPDVVWTKLQIGQHIKLPEKK